MKENGVLDDIRRKSVIADCMKKLLIYNRRKRVKSCILGKCILGEYGSVSLFNDDV